MVLKNIEIKARLNNINTAEDSVIKLCGKPTTTEFQTDTFFNTQSGRLKLRESSKISALIYYNRRNSKEPTHSDIAISFVEDTDSLKSVLSKSHGVRGIVKKERKLYLNGQTRIHLDCVEDLGNFIELEVVLKDNQTNDDGIKIAYNLMQKLDIQETDLIDVAYIDLLESKNSSI